MGFSCAQTKSYLPLRIMKLPPLATLRAFEAAARRTSFSLAAVELGMTATAVSQHVRNLEAWLGVPLFERHARGVRLTPGLTLSKKDPVRQPGARGSFFTCYQCEAPEPPTATMEKGWPSTATVRVSFRLSASTTRTRAWRGSEMAT